MVIKIIWMSIVRFLNFLPLLFIAIVAGQIVNTLLSAKKSKKFLKHKKNNIIRVSGIGLISPGPLSAYLPVLKALNKNGLPLSAVVAFITAQTLVGPMRLFLEVSYFGIVFFIFRVIMSFFIAIFIGVYYRLLEIKGEFK